MSLSESNMLTLLKITGGDSLVYKGGRGKGNQEEQIEGDVEDILSVITFFASVVKRTSCHKKVQPYFFTGGQLKG